MLENALADFFPPPIDRPNSPVRAAGGHEHRADAAEAEGQHRHDEGVDAGQVGQQAGEDPPEGVADAHHGDEKGGVGGRDARRLGQLGQVHVGDVQAHGGEEVGQGDEEKGEVGHEPLRAGGRHERVAAALLDGRGTVGVGVGGGEPACTGERVGGMSVDIKLSDLKVGALFKIFWSNLSSRTFRAPVWLDVRKTAAQFHFYIVI